MLVNSKCSRLKIDKISNIIVDIHYFTFVWCLASQRVKSTSQTVHTETFKSSHLWHGMRQSVISQHMHTSQRRRMLASCFCFFKRYLRAFSHLLRADRISVFSNSFTTSYTVDCKILTREEEWLNGLC